jgi:hypothetical protein
LDPRSFTVFATVVPRPSRTPRDVMATVHVILHDGSRTTACACGSIDAPDTCRLPRQPVRIQLIAIAADAPEHGGVRVALIDLDAQAYEAPGSIPGDSGAPVFVFIPYAFRASEAGCSPIPSGTLPLPRQQSQQRRSPAEAPESATWPPTSDARGLSLVVGSTAREI